MSCWYEELKNMTKNDLDTEIYLGNIDPNDHDPFGWTPLHVFAKLGGREDIECARLLIDKYGVSTESRTKGDSTPLHLAIGSLHYGMICLLLDLGANPNALDKHNDSPLFTAVNILDSVFPHQYRIIKTLLKYGADTGESEIIRVEWKKSKILIPILQWYQNRRWTDFFDVL